MTQLLQLRDQVSNFLDFLSALLGYFQNLCSNFKAGQIANNYSNWTQCTSDKDILSDVRGVKIECIARPVQHKLPFPKFTEHEHAVVEQEVESMIKKGVVEQTSFTPGQIV